MSMATRTERQSPALQVADSHDLIRVHGARVNNLKDVSIEIPKRRLTVFTGVSGSGKSSLVFGTIAAESQRLINETYSAFVQGFMPTLARPEVDVLDGLTTAISVDQERMGSDPRSTVGTATDANAMLRILFSRLGKPHIGSPSAFAFNVPTVRASGGITVERGNKTQTKKATFNRLGGMCPRCEGRGSVTDFDLSALYDDSKSLNEGALTIPGCFRLIACLSWYIRVNVLGARQTRSPVRNATTEEITMPDHEIGSREEWQEARDALAKLEAQHAELNEEIKKQRLALPWVPVEKDYEFDTEEGKKTLPELFDGRSQLLAYNIMYGPDYQVGACPGCTSLGDEFSGPLIHLNERDVTFLCFSRAPIDRLTAYKERMGWEFPYVSTYETDFPWDFGLAMTEDQAEQIPEVKEMIESPPDWLQEWSEQIGAELKDGLREGPGYIAFARDNGTVYHTYTVMAPDPFVAPHFTMLLERTPKAQPDEPRSWRKDEYPN